MRANSRGERDSTREESGRLRQANHDATQASELRERMVREGRAHALGIGKAGRDTGEGSGAWIWVSEAWEQSIGNLARLMHST